VLVVWVFIVKGYFPGNISGYIMPLALIALTTTAVESLPFSDIDNLTVPLTAVLMGLLFF